jgi:hypothetical protein
MISNKVTKADKTILVKNKISVIRNDWELSRNKKLLVETVMEEKCSQIIIFFKKNSRLRYFCNFMFFPLWEDFAIVPSICKGILLHHLIYCCMKDRYVIHIMLLYFNSDI